MLPTLLAFIPTNSCHHQDFHKLPSKETSTNCLLRWTGDLSRVTPPLAHRLLEIGTSSPRPTYCFFFSCSQWKTYEFSLPPC
ncbi:hypothetical protein CHARACLAT_027070 [Characodon lateralis]|uniref:Uncharacterized protein n=1 Tax=Characodon lateralis TaxID=208331 RepID=A0ABU7E4M5_9TELE|nr:hypothetical protein [Characodon lateralis]